MSCKQMFARLSAYLDGELPEESCRVIRRHMEGCERCRAFCRTLQRTVALCRQLPPKPLPEEVRHALRALLARWERDASR